MLSLKKQKNTPSLLFAKESFLLDQRIVKNIRHKTKKNFQYLFLLKKFAYDITYKNINLLKYFLTKYGKISSRKNTQLSIKLQKKISKAIKHSRAKGLLSFAYVVS